MFWADFLKSVDVAQRVISIETLMEVSLCTLLYFVSPGLRASPGCWFPGALAARGRQLLCKLSSETIAWNQAPGNKLQISVPSTANCSEIFFFNPVSVLPQFSAIWPHWPSTLQL